jgi:beta-propeller repeat-containing protein
MIDTRMGRIRPLISLGFLAVACGSARADGGLPEGPALVLPGGVRWTLVGAQRGTPRSENGKLVYDDVYPGIALTLEPRAQSVEYRFDVAPGADPSAIRMRYEEAHDVVADEMPGAASLHVQVGTQVLREQGLRCLQESDGGSLVVACRYAMILPNGVSEVAFAVGPYDRARRLVIDPVIRWSSYLGGSSGEGGLGIALDPAGNLYVTGNTGSTDFPVLGGFATGYGGGGDAFVAKIDASGPGILWSSYLGGSDFDTGDAIAVDSTGNVYVVGSTHSSDFPTPGGFDTTFGGGVGANDAYVAKVNAAGSSLDWSSFLGGSKGDAADAVAVDSAGNVYVTGGTHSSDFPTMGGFDTTHGGGGLYDAFVTKVNAAGSSLAWSSFLGGSDSDQGEGIAVDSAGNVYVAGSTDSTNFPMVGAFDTTYDGFWSEGFVTKVNAAGSSLAWSSYLGGSYDDSAHGLAIDSARNVYVAGHTESSDFPILGGFDTTYGGLAGDAFVTKVNAAGSSLAWSSFLGGSNRDDGQAVALDLAGDVYVTGKTLSTDFPTPNGFGTDYGGPGGDAFVSKVSGAGSSLIWSSYLGGSSEDEGFGIGVDAAGHVYVTGDTYSTDFPTPGGFDTVYGGTGTLGDAFVTDICTSNCCGDGTCDMGEDPCRCPADCGPDTCGNGCCGPTEDATNCNTSSGGDCPSVCADGACTAGEQDCPTFCATDCAEVCGDGCCTENEDPCNCPADCGPDTCGNGCCGPTEDATNCNTVSGGDCPSVCGDGACTAGEQDCPTFCVMDCLEACGDGCCTASEDACTCVFDCGPDACGNGCCGPAEDECTCPADCGPDTCGNGCCGPAETACTCAADCSGQPGSCGDGCCAGGEDCSTCGGAGEDCTCGPGILCDTSTSPAVCVGCGDGICQGGVGETACNCSVDCTGVDVVGDGCCSGAENACTEPACAESCGDSCCTGAEACGTCPADCGPCLDMGIDVADLGSETGVDAPADVAAEPADAGADLAQDGADAGRDMAADRVELTDRGAEEGAPPLDGRADEASDSASPDSGVASGTGAGCSCDLGRGRPHPPALGVFLALATLLDRRWRRRPRRAPCHRCRHGQDDQAWRRPIPDLRLHDVLAQGLAVLRQRRDRLEAQVEQSVIEGLKREVLRPEAVDRFVRRFRERVHEHLARERQDRTPAKIEADLVKTRQEIERLLDLYLAGGQALGSVRDAITTRERQVVEMERLAELRGRREPADLLPHPTVIKSYLTDLTGTLEADTARARRLLERHVGPVRLTWKNEGPKPCYWASGRFDFGPLTEGRKAQGVAGARFELATFGL